MRVCADASFSADVLRMHLRSLWRTSAIEVARDPTMYRPLISLRCSPRRSTVLYGVASLFSAAFAFHHVVTSPPIHLDGPSTAKDVVGKFLACHAVCRSQLGPTSVDPATSVEFPKELRVPSKFPLPSHTLLGVGVRTVSFLGIQAYSVGFYADLTAQKLKVQFSFSRIGIVAYAKVLQQIPPSATPEEKINYIVRNASCVLRIGKNISSLARVCQHTHTCSTNTPHFVHPPARWFRPDLDYSSPARQVLRSPFR